MKVINATLVPWLIAKDRYNVSDSENIEPASDMFVIIIIAKELDGYTKKTFPLAIEWKKVKQNNFSKHVLLTIGMQPFIYLSSMD
jgi:hypothetical protein